MSDSLPVRGELADRHVVILGLMGAGKSTTGSALAVRLGRPYADSDRDIEWLLGRTGRDVAAAEGVATLHRVESAVLLGALSSRTPAVITAAASVVEDELARAALAERAYVVRLDVSPDVALTRQVAGAHRRPMTRDELVAVAARREPMFSSVEHLRVDADGETFDVVSEIVSAVTSERATNEHA